MSNAMTLEALQAILDDSPFTRFLGLKVDSHDPKTGEVTCRLSPRPETQRLSDSAQIHGGVLAAIIDAAGDLVVAQKVGGAVPTIDMRVDYLRPVGEGDVMVQARAQKIGRMLGIVDVQVFDSAERMCVLGRASYVSRLG